MIDKKYCSNFYTTFNSITLIPTNRCRVLKENCCSCIMFKTKVFNYKEKAKEEKVKKKCNKYTFKTTPKFIDWDLIAEDLSYEEPMCILEYGKKTFVIIHRSIYQKVILSDNSFCELELNSDGSHTIVRIDKSDIDWYKHEVKMVKEAKWNKSTKIITVTKINV